MIIFTYGKFISTIDMTLPQSDVIFINGVTMSMEERLRFDKDLAVQSIMLIKNLSCESVKHVYIVVPTRKLKISTMNNVIVLDLFFFCYTRTKPRYKVSP